MHTRRCCGYVHERAILAGATLVIVHLDRREVGIPYACFGQSQTHAGIPLHSKEQLATRHRRQRA